MRVHLEKLHPRSLLGAEIQLSCLALRLHEPLKNLFAVTTVSETQDLPLRHMYISHPINDCMLCSCVCVCVCVCVLLFLHYDLTLYLSTIAAKLS